MNIKKVKQINSEYSQKGVEESKYEKLVALDKKAKKPARIFSYSFGILGALVLGTGMSVSMGVFLPSLGMTVGIIVGLAGIAIVGVNYPLYKSIAKRSKKKYEKEIISLSDELLAEKS